MITLPFDLAGLDSSEVDRIEDVYKTLTAKFDVEIPGDFNVDVNQFDFIRCYQDVDHHTEITLGGVLQINNTANNCYLAFLKVRYYYANTAHYYASERLDYYKYLICGLVNLKKDFGRILIRRETFTDRVLSVVHPVELEFKDDKAFSHKFYVVANDETKALNAMTWDFRNAIMEIENKDILIEIADNLLMVGNNCGVETEDVVYAAEIAKKIAAVR